MEESGRIKIVGAFYDMETGKVYERKRRLARILPRPAIMALASP